MLPHVNIDLETASAVDLTAVGAHVYAEHPTTHILCMAYRLSGRHTQLWWPGEPFPADLVDAILMGGVMNAWNAAFERIMWKHLVALGAPPVPLEQWRCTMVRALLQGFPGALANAGPSMGLGACKDEEGHRLMLQLCKPRQRWQPGKKGYDAARAKVDGCEYQLIEDDEVVRWWMDPERKQRLGAYCVRDVDTEAAADAFLDPMPEKEVQGWQLDQRINDRGFYVDQELVLAAFEQVKPATAKANQDMANLTGGELAHVTKPNEIRAWLNRELGLELASIDKKVLNDLLVTMEDQLPPTVKQVIQLRLAAAKTSTAKLRALLNGTMEDSRFRGGLQYAGAGRTNRWAGRRFQPQNLPRPAKWALAAVGFLLDRCGVEALEAVFGSALEVISSILRSCITAGPGNELHFGDFNAIEARITAWLCNATKLLDAYATGKDPYRRMAGKVLGVDPDTIDKESFERFLGKQIILGCGFGMGDKRFQGQCRDFGVYIELELATRSVYTYRDDNPEIPQGWRDLERAAESAMKHPGQFVPALDGKVYFLFQPDQSFMRVRLPSGRYLSYRHPRLVEDVTPWGRECLKFQFWGWNGERNRMEWQHMYGGKWMENIVQATARDVMLDAMLRLDADGWNLILSVHDETGAEEIQDARTLERFIEVMKQPPDYAPDLPLEVEGWTGQRYRK